MLPGVVDWRLFWLTLASTTWLRGPRDSIAVDCRCDGQQAMASPWHKRVLLVGHGDLEGMWRALEKMSSAGSGGG